MKAPYSPEEIARINLTKKIICEFFILTFYSHQKIFRQITYIFSKFTETVTFTKILRIKFERKISFKSKLGRLHYKNTQEYPL